MKAITTFKYKMLQDAFLKRRSMKKSQSSIEFVILIAFMLMVVVTFFAFTTNKISESSGDANIQLAEDIADIPFKEVMFAKTVSDGYSRVFTMPSQINNKPYQIAIIGNHEIVVNFSGIEAVKFLPDNVSGYLTFGDHLITKEKGNITITPIQNSAKGELVMKTNDVYVTARFNSTGSLRLREELDSVAPQNMEGMAINTPSKFFFRDVTGQITFLIDTNTGNAFYSSTKSVFQSQASLSPGIDDFIIINSLGEIVAYFSADGNLYLKGIVDEDVESP